MNREEAIDIIEHSAKVLQFAGYKRQGEILSEALQALEILKTSPGCGWQSKAQKLWDEVGCNYNTEYAIRHKRTKNWLFNMVFDEGEEGAFFTHSFFDQTDEVGVDDFDLVVEMKDVLQPLPVSAGEAVHIHSLIEELYSSREIQEYDLEHMRAFKVGYQKALTDLQQRLTNHSEEANEIPD